MSAWVCLAIAGVALMVGFVGGVVLVRERSDRSFVVSNAGCALFGLAVLAVSFGLAGWLGEVLS